MTTRKFGQGGNLVADDQAVAVELLGTVLSTGGVGLLIVAVILRLLHGTMIKTQAVLIDHHGTKALRWYDTSYIIHEVPYDGSIPPVPGRTVEIPIYYSARNRHDWQIHPPHRGLKALTVLGLILAGAGTVLPYFLP
jgi:hypothetical protein